MTIAKPSKPLCFYADDFTGATAHLAGFVESGMSGLLFLNTPSDSVFKRYSRDIDVIGIAGVSRSLPSSQIIHEVKPAFQLFKEIEAVHIHYKVCSTFDSSPTVGSIGAVLDLADQQFGPMAKFVAVACPRFGRYVVFGNLFAIAGGSNEVARLDRHPTMSKHPSTPMTESDLRMQLKQQTNQRGGLVNLLVMDQGIEQIRKAVRLANSQKSEYIVFDGLTDTDMDLIAEIELEKAIGGHVFTIAAQGLAEALGRKAAKANVDSKAVCHPIKDESQMLVMSGSAAPQTAEQIEKAIAAGWTAIRIDVIALLHDPSAVMRDLARWISDALHNGNSVVAFTAIGPDDPMVEKVRNQTASLPPDAVARAIGSLFAGLARVAVEQCGVRRFILAGGDTSSLAMRQFGADALSIAAHGVFGGRLSRLHSSNPALDGVEVMLKGGQVGSPQTFVTASQASSWKLMV